MPNNKDYQLKYAKKNGIRSEDYRKDLKLCPHPFLLNTSGNIPVPKFYLGRSVQGEATKLLKIFEVWTLQEDTSNSHMRLKQQNSVTINTLTSALFPETG